MEHTIQLRNRIDAFRTVHLVFCSTYGAKQGNLIIDNDELVVKWNKKPRGHLVKKNNYVKLDHFFIDYLDALNAFELPEEQGQFTALPNAFLDVAEGQYRIVILSDDEPVGFFLLHTTERVMEIRWEDIDEIIEDRSTLEKKLTKSTIDFVARDFEKAYPDVIIKLKHPQEATLLMGMKKNYEQVAIRVDEPEKFKEVLKSKL